MMDWLNGNGWMALCLAVGVLAPLLLALRSSMMKELLRDLRLPRILHYVALALMGFAAANDTACCVCTPVGWTEALLLGLYALGLAYSAVFAIVTNNLEDVEADRISNPGRPTVRGTVARGPYLRAGLLALAIGLCLSALSGWGPLLGVASASLGYWIYSCRPLRLKRVPILSKLIIGANSAMVAMGGFLLRDDLPLENFLPWGLFILIPLGFSANFIDLKDTEGDRAAGISTLPVLMGERRARHLIAGFTVMSYATSALLMGKWYLAPVVAALMGVHLWLLYRRPYREAPIFLVYVAGLFSLDAILLVYDKLP